MPSPRTIALRFGALLAGASVIAAVVLACEDDPHKRTSKEQATTTGGACSAPPGQFPEPNCDNSDKKCDPTPGCTIDEARCGSATTCLPIGSNKGKDVLDFRIRRLNIAAPPQLATDFIQNTVVTLNIDLNEQSCGELGKGLFTWLLQVDKKQNTLTTGGAPPPSDPIGQGFCFATFDVGGSKVEPMHTSIAFDANGTTFKTLEKKKLSVPIFLANELASVVLLPLSDVILQGVTLSNDGDCIGAFNQAALDPTCVDDRALCSKWATAGSLGGYITLEEADTVKIRDLSNKSLCSLLAGDSTLACARDGAGKIVFKGDYCSTDKTPASCADSVWLAATFAASAAKIFDGTGTVAGCSGTTVATDAGTDASDASADSGDAGDGG